MRDSHSHRNEESMARRSESTNNELLPWPSLYRSNLASCHTNDGTLRRAPSTDTLYVDMFLADWEDMTKRELALAQRLT